MRKEYTKILKSLFCESLSACQEDQQLTLDKMADRLEMSTRSYADLKSGNNGCSGLTLALFSIYVCPDASEFLRKLRDALEASGNKAA